MQLTLPSGTLVTPPVAPRTWVEQAGVVYGDPLSAKALEADVAAAIAFHRQRPMFQGINVAGTSIATSTWTPQPLAEIIDNASGHNDSANTSRWYCPATANATDWYLVIGYVPMNSGNAANVHIAGLRVNGTGTIREGSKLTSNAAHTTVTPMIVDLIPMSSGDYLELMGWQNTGGPISTPTAGKTPSLSVTWVCSGTGTTVALPGVPRTWTAADALTADTTGAGKVPLNLHLRDILRWLNYSPVARLTAVGTTQAIVSGTGYTSIALPAEDVDNYGGHDNVTNNSRYTFQRDGLYTIAGQYSQDETGGANAGYRSVRLLHTIAAGGTATYYGASAVPGTTTTVGTHLVAVAHIRAVAGDYVEVQGQHTQAANRNVLGAANNAARLIVVWRSR